MEEHVEVIQSEGQLEVLEKAWLSEQLSLQKLRNCTTTGKLSPAFILVTFFP